MRVWSADAFSVRVCDSVLLLPGGRYLHFTRSTLVVVSVEEATIKYIIGRHKKESYLSL
jgi:hypothetical protein